MVKVADSYLKLKGKNPSGFATKERDGKRRSNTFLNEGYNNGENKERGAERDESLMYTLCLFTRLL